MPASWTSLLVPQLEVIREVKTLFMTPTITSSRVVIGRFASPLSSTGSDSLVCPSPAAAAWQRRVCSTS
jgi:hypothetical protein